MANIRRMTKKRLGELLLQEGLVTEEQLQESLEEQEETGELIGDILVRKGFVTETDVARTISMQFSFPYLSVLHYYISPEMLEPFSLEMLERHLFVPIDRFGDVLSIVIAGLLDQNVIDEIEQQTKCTVQVYVGKVSEVKQAIKEKLAGTKAKKSSKAKAAKGGEKVEAGVMVDVTAPPEAPVKSSKSSGEEDIETIDLSEAIKAAEATRDEESVGTEGIGEEEVAREDEAAEPGEGAEEENGGNSMMDKVKKKFRFFDGEDDKDE